MVLFMNIRSYVAFGNYEFSPQIDAKVHVFYVDLMPKMHYYKLPILRSLGDETTQNPTRT